jgi:hypothetical protein
MRLTQQCLGRHNIASQCSVVEFLVGLLADRFCGGQIVDQFLEKLIQSWLVRGAGILVAHISESSPTIPDSCSPL